MQVDHTVLGVHRNKIYKALVAEGVQGLQIDFTVIPKLPMFKKKIAYGPKGFPWTINKYSKKIKYSEKSCPSTYNMLDNKYLGLLLCSYDFKIKDAKNIVNAFQKVWGNLKLL